MGFDIIFKVVVIVQMFKLLYRVQSYKIFWNFLMSEVKKCMN